jgi:nucleoid DNA-binding protein
MAQADPLLAPPFEFLSHLVSMAPMKKAMKASGSKAMTKGALLKLVATENEMKTKDCSNILNSLVTVATKEVKKTGIFPIPGLCRIKTRVKPATKAGVRVMFGEEKKVKAKPARTVVKAYPVAALKKQI